MLATIKPILLPTDILIWVMAVLAVISIILAARREHWRNAWRQVATNGTAMASLGILICFLGVALADSVHYQTREGENWSTTCSLLDDIFGSLVNAQETSYSSPFATRGFDQKSIVTENGIERGYPRLTHAGAHLENESSRSTDVLIRIGAGLVVGALVGILISVVSMNLWRRRTGQEISRSRTRGALIFGGLMGAVLITLVAIGGKYHILGTDKVGNSTLLACLKSVRTALVIGTLTTLMVTPIAVGLGVLAGYLRGWVDDVVQYLYTTFSSIPAILLIAAAMMIVQTQLQVGESTHTADLQLLGLCMVLALTSWAGLCRLVRAEALKLREIEYVQAARSLGLGQAKIMLRHLVPNVLHLVLIDMVLKFSALVLAEVVLAYIGIGVHTETESFGHIIRQAQEELARSPVIWWNLFASFGFMLALVVPANLLADAVRDALDPKLRVQRN
jgi:peptide/nickel transport system permease protein